MKKMIVLELIGIGIDIWAYFVKPGNLSVILVWIGLLILLIPVLYFALQKSIFALWAMSVAGILGFASLTWNTRPIIIGPLMLVLLAAGITCLVFAIGISLRPKS